MGKRLSQSIKNKTSRSRKTAKRLAVKRVMITAKKAKAAKKKK
jgi:hypothetical protein